MAFQLPKFIPITVERIYQRIKAENLFEPIPLEPQYVRHMYVDNVVTRTLARVVAQGPYGPVVIRANEQGYLYVAGLGGGYKRNEVKKLTAPDNYATPISFSQPVGRMDIYVFDNRVIFKRSYDGQTWDDEWEIFADSMLSIDVLTKSFNVKNATTGAPARLQVVGYYSD